MTRRRAQLAILRGRSGCLLDGTLRTALMPVDAVLRQYQRSRPRSARLAEIAQTLRAWGPLSDALQVLQA